MKRSIKGTHQISNYLILFTQPLRSGRIYKYLAIYVCMFSVDNQILFVNHKKDENSELKEKVDRRSSDKGWFDCFVYMLYFGVCIAKHPHNLLRVGDKVGESSKWNHEVLIKNEDVTRKKLRLQIFWTLKIDLLLYFLTINIKRQREKF